MTNKHTELPWNSNTLLSEHDYKWAAHCVNYHDRLREALEGVVDEWVYGDDIFGPIQKARSLLDEIDNLEPKQ